MSILWRLLVRCILHGCFWIVSPSGREMVLMQKPDLKMILKFFDRNHHFKFRWVQPGAAGHIHYDVGFRLQYPGRVSEERKSFVIKIASIIYQSIHSFFCARSRVSPNRRIHYSWGCGCSTDFRGFLEFYHCRKELTFLASSIIRGMLTGVIPGRSHSFSRYFIISVTASDER